jgi:hypothetical protein
MHVQSRRWSLGLVPPLLLALGLRWLGLHNQILTDDELHTVHGALAMPVRDIVQTWTFGGADYGVPQAAFYRLLMDQGFVFSELSFRIPSLLAGLVAVFVLPCLTVNRIGERAAVVLAWLLAISPMLTLYSRIVRPYMPATLLATTAVLFFFRWWTTRSIASAIGYVLCAVSAVYFHLVAAPLVLAPLAYAVVDGFIRSEADRNRLIRLFALGSITVLLILAALLPAYESIFEIVKQKRDGLAPGLQTILDVTRLQIGTGSTLIAILAALIGLRGLCVLWREDRPLLFFIGSLVAAQILALFVFAPDRIEESMVFNRYLLILLPLVLIPIASGLIEPWLSADSASARRIEAGCAAVGIAALFFAGPLTSTQFLSRPFSHTLASMNFLEPNDQIPYQYVPRFYHQLGESTKDKTVLEYPWQNVSSQAFDAYQQVHGGPVLVASIIDRTNENRIALRNHIEPTPSGFLESRANYLVVHLDLRSESSRLETSSIHHRQWLRAEAELWAPLRRAGRSMASRLYSLWGTPAYSDQSLQVWDLNAVRRGHQGGE